MTEKVKQAIERWHMLNGVKCVAVGLSGGADSVSLLHCLSVLSGDYGFMLRAVHVNHGIRGDAADSDERFCVELCRKMNIPLEVFRFDVPSLAAERGAGLEECGRQCRYGCFSEISEKYGCVIATAHTLSDSTETMLLNMTRGCGTAGLRGIPPVRDFVVRPLILCTRDEIEAYCRDNSLSFVTDATNFDDAYSRNRVRLRIVPEIKKMNPSFCENASRLMENASLDEDFLRNAAQTALDEAAVPGGGWKISALAGLHPSLRRRAVIIAAEQLWGIQPEYSQVLLTEKMLIDGNGAVTFSGGRCMCAANDRLTEQVKQVKRSKSTAPEWCVCAESTVHLPDGRILEIETVDYDEFVKRAEKNKFLFKSAVGCDIIQRNVLLRYRREGDSIRQAGRGVTKKLKKLFNESRIPLEERGRLAVAELEGAVIWVEHFGAAEGFAPAMGCGRVSIISLT